MVIILGEISIKLITQYPSTATTINQFKSVKNVLFQNKRTEWKSICLIEKCLN